MIPSAYEKITGAIIGNAVGDALGLGTEFMSLREVSRRYPDGLTEYSQIIHDAHRSLFPRAGWTADTSSLLIVIESIVSNNSIDVLDVAKRLKSWFTSHLDIISPDVRFIYLDEEFATDPYNTAVRVRKEMGDDRAPNDPMGKAIVAALWEKDFTESTRNLTRITHPNARCIASTMMMAKMVHSLMWHNSPASYDELVEIGRTYSPATLPYLETARFGALRDLHLDDPDNCWFVRKTMASALWAVWHCQTPEEALLSMVAEGGDADTNAAVATALLGLKCGVSAIPQKYIDGLCGKEKLLDLADRFAKAVIAKHGL